MTTKRDHPGQERPERFGGWVIRNRWPILAVGLLVAAVLGAGVPRLGFEDDYRVYFSERNPQLQAFEKLQNVYTKNDNLLFVLAPRDGRVFTPSTLAAVEELTEAAWQIPFAIRVDSVTNFQHTRADGDDLIVEDLVEDAASRTPEEIAAAAQVALAEPLLVGRLVSRDAGVTGVNVKVQLPGERSDEVSLAVAEAREIVDRIRAEHPGIDLYLSGVVMLNNAFVEAAMDDMATLVPLMYAVLILAMILLLRSVSGTVSTLAVLALSTVAAMGLAGWIGIPLTPTAAIAPTMILTLAVADSVHILLTLLDAMRRGASKRDALLESLRVNLQPVFLTSLTTAIGFLSMNFSDAPPLRDLGNITAMGVAAAFGFSVLFLPALVSVLPLRVRARAASSRGRAMERFAEVVVARRRVLLWSSTAAVLALALFVPANELNDQFVRYFDERIQFRTDTDFTTANLTGVYQAQFSVGARDSGGISEPDYLRRLDEFAQWWRRQPGVVHVDSLSDTMKRLNRNMHGDDPAYHRLPESRELAAQYLLLYEMSLPYGLDLNDQINVDKSATRFTVTLGDLKTSEMLDLAARGEDWLRYNAPAWMFARATGPAIMFSHISARNIASMLKGTALALILISGCLVIALRSWRMGLLSLIPNLAPAAMGFGAWALMAGQVGFGLSTVVAMTLGIVVDDTVHFISKYRRARVERGLAPEDAVRYAFRSVGEALWATSAILVAGFAVLSFSTFAQNAEMGQLTAITIVFALLTDFLLLPSLLLTLDRRRERARVRAIEPLPTAG